MVHPYFTCFPWVSASSLLSFHNPVMLHSYCEMTAHVGSLPSTTAALFSLAFIFSCLEILTSFRLSHSIYFRYAVKHGYPVLQYTTLPRMGAMQVVLDELSPTSIKQLNGTHVGDCQQGEIFHWNSYMKFE